MLSESLFERAKAVSPGGVHSPVRAFKGVGGVPRFIREAKGSRITDVDGKSYIDFCMAWGPMILGHADSEIKEAVLSAIGRGWSFGTAEEGSLELAEWIVREIPWVEKIRFVNTGTEAVMSALRVARGVTGRPYVLKFDGCYHGHADSMLVRAGSGLAEMASPDSAGVSASVAAETRVVPLDDLAALEAEFNLNGNKIAAVIVEPVPANNGLLLQREGFLQAVAKLAKKYGALLIFDEVITGFRVGLTGMAGYAGIDPDLVTYGKIIGGGFPVGAYGGKKKYMDLVAPLGPVYQAGTLSANPVAMASGLATLKKLKRLNPYSELAAQTDQFCRSLERKLSGKLDRPVKLQNFASMFWPVLGKSQVASESQDSWVRSIAQAPVEQKNLYAPLFHECLDKGVYLAPSAFEVGFLSTAHTRADLDFVLNCL